MKISILTPTYNRANLLKNLYKTLEIIGKTWYNKKRINHIKRA